MTNTATAYVIPREGSIEFRINNAERTSSIQDSVDIPPGLTYQDLDLDIKGDEILEDHGYEAVNDGWRRLGKGWITDCQKV